MLEQIANLAAVDIVTACVKMLYLLAALQAAGSAIFVLLYRRHLVNSLTSITNFAATSSAFSAALAIAYQVLSAARMSGEFSGVWDASLEQLGWFSSSGAAAVVRVFGSLAVLVGLKRRVDAYALIGAAAIVVSFVFTGHTTTYSPHIMLAALLVIHVAIVAFWFGALPALLFAVKRESSSQAVAAFSAHATLLVPCLALAGIAMAWVFLPTLAALSTPYGLALLTKTNAFALLLALAAYNKLRLVRAIERRDAKAIAAFSRVVKVEYVVIVIVLCATASMTTLFPPE